MTSVSHQSGHDRLAAYLQRVGAPGLPRLDGDFLNDLQRSHLRSVPFEALDICPLRKSFGLEREGLYDKIVNRHRGGYCFELNGLLAMMLEEIGFRVQRLEARFPNPTEKDRSVYDHLVLHVSVPGEQQTWFVDVGAGRETPDGIVPVGGTSADGRHAVSFDSEHWFLTEIEVDGTSRSTIEWRPEPVQLSDFAQRNRDLQEDPASPFRKGPLCTILNGNGRMTISRWTLIDTQQDERTERQIGDLAEVHALLRGHFGITQTFEQWWDEDPT